MASFLDRFKKSGEEAEDANAVISQFNEDRSKKRVEIENSPYFFYAVPTLRSGAVVITTPERLKTLVSEGQWLRIRVPDSDRKDVRLQITSARHGGTGSMATTPDFFSLLCKIPGASVETTKRAADRYSTMQFKDLLLDLTAPSAGSYPIIDISAHGLKIHVSSQKEIERFVIGQELSKGRIRLGTRARVDLMNATPRAHFETAVGLEIVVNPQGPSRSILDMFLGNMEHRAQGGKAKPAGDAEKKPPEPE
jgi:hypothetical protein